MKILNIIIVLLILNLTNTTAFAETQKDCSKYNTDTIMGTWNKHQCLKGQPQAKNKANKEGKKLNLFKKGQSKQEGKFIKIW